MTKYIEISVQFLFEILYNGKTKYDLYIIIYTIL